MENAAKEIVKVSDLVPFLWIIASFLGGVVVWFIKTLLGDIKAGLRGKVDQVDCDKAHKAIDKTIHRHASTGEVIKE